MMNRNELRELMERLEAFEALAKLFNNLWFDKIRDDIADAKVQAYLTVFDDAFPHMNHVIEFVRRSAGLLSAGDAGQEQWARLQSEFDYLHRLLKSESDEMLEAVAPPVAPPAAPAAPKTSPQKSERPWRASSRATSTPCSPRTRNLLRQGTQRRTIPHKTLTPCLTRAMSLRKKRSTKRIWMPSSPMTMKTRSLVR